jgi:soluble lytic murein transglycosylase-like protein
VKSFGWLLMLLLSSTGYAGSSQSSRQEAEYYVAAYARYYHVPVDFVRAVVEQESGWHRCAVSAKGAVGLMQLMPATAARLNVLSAISVSAGLSKDSPFKRRVARQRETYPAA